MHDTRHILTHYPTGHTSPAFATLPMLMAITSLVMLTACGRSGSSTDDSTVASRAIPRDSGMAMDSAGARNSNSGKSMGSDEQKVLDELGALGGKPIETLTPAEARKQPTPKDAVMSLLKKEGKPVTPEPVGGVANRTIPGPGGPLPIRVYTPQGDGNFPVVVYFHGGGFVIATNDTYDASARALTNAAKAVVVSVEYRKAPEHKFPAAHDDALAAYKWVVANAASIRGDASRVALAGESAGGNLAIATAIAAKAAGGQAPVSVLAVYPVTQGDTTTASYTQNAMAKPLNRPMMTWFFNKYTRSPADAKDPRLNLVGANLAGLPPVTIITAQFDPLRSDGEMLADRLKAAGVSVDIRNYDNVAHEFFGQGAAVSSAKDAVEFGADGLKKGFNK